MSWFKYLYLVVAAVFLGVAVLMLVFIEGMIWPLTVPLFAIGLGAVALFGYALFKELRARDIIENGNDGTGTYVKHVAYSPDVNSLPSYVIFFTFTNDEGRLIETKTETEYHRDEVEAVAALKTFPIKYRGDLGFIDKETILEILYRKDLENKPEP